jgi:surface carbohydrate biosynthesis protein (TIGR04326 family)
LVKRFNLQRQDEGFHSFIDAYLSCRIVFRVLKRWIRLLFLSGRFRSIEFAFRPDGSQFSMWPIMKGDWFKSMRGQDAIKSLLWIELFDSALSAIPHQHKGFYLYENLRWEQAFIHAWRKHGHGLLIAVQHSTVRFWDLRYFNDPRTIRSSGPHPKPQADLTALNGKAAVDSYLSVEFPKEAIVECEALRYGYLHDLRTVGLSKKARGAAIKILILGDYHSSGTMKMLQLLEAAVPHISAHATYTFKPHPNFPVRTEDYPALQLKLVTDPLGEILCNYDLAYSSNMTSASVDAYLAGLPVVVMLDESELNFSPLRGQPGVCFVSSPEELAESLKTEGQPINSNNSEFFYLEPDLPRWKRLLRFQ